MCKTEDQDPFSVYADLQLSVTVDPRRLAKIGVFHERNMKNVVILNLKFENNVISSGYQG